MRSRPLLPTGVHVIEEIGVVIPARNEAETLSRSVHAVLDACTAFDGPVHVVVVLDACTDGSSDVAAELVQRSAGRVSSVSIDAGSAGAARRAGADILLERSVADHGRLWIANTDADSVVPRAWLVRQVAHARLGAQIVAGTVEVTDWSAWSPATRREYECRYRQYGPHSVGGHGHIHGANLGVRADVYEHLGGFRPDPTGEDVDLVQRARRCGAAITWARDLAVATSARPSGRAPGGFAEHLAELVRPDADSQELPVSESMTSTSSSHN